MRPLTLYILACYFTFTTNASNFADKEYYLVDSLVLDELVPDDRRLLDSCLAAYHKSPADLNRINTLVGICENLMHESWKDYQYLQLQLIEKALEKEWESQDLKEINRMLAGALNNMGLIYYAKGLIPQAINAHKKSLRIGKKLGEASRMIHPLNNLARIYYDKGNIDKSIEYANEALRKCVVARDEKSTASVLHLLGQTSRNRGDILRAFDYDQKAFRIKKIIGDKFGMAESLNSLALHYTFLNQKDKALEFYKQSLGLYKEIGNRFGEASTLVNMGDIYKGKSLYYQAYMLYSKGLELYRRIGQKKNEASTLNRIGRIHAKQSEDPKALSCYRRSLKLSTEIGNKRIISASILNISKLYLRNKQFDTASFYAEKALLIGKEIGMVNLIKSSTQILSETYSHAGDSMKALKMYRLYGEMKDSLDRTELAKTITKMEYEQEVDKQNRKIKLLNKNRELDRAKFRMSFILYGLFILFLLVFGYLSYRRKRKKYEKELNELRALKLESKSEEFKETLASMLVKRGRRLSTIDLLDVICFKGESNYVLLEDKEGKEYIVDHTLTKLEEILPDNFVRIHRSSIINKVEISSISKGHRGKCTFVMKGEGGISVNSSGGYLEVTQQLAEEFSLKL